MVGKSWQARQLALKCRYECDFGGGHAVEGRRCDNLVVEELHAESASMGGAEAFGLLGVRCPFILVQARVGFLPVSQWRLNMMNPMQEIAVVGDI